MRFTSRSTGLAVALLMFAAGCASNEAKQRLALLEQTNRDLTERVNALQGNIDSCVAERDQLAQQLAAARGETEQLRGQLANLPTPEQAPPGWTPVPGGAMIAIEDSVLFPVGKATLRESARRVLDHVISTLRSEYGDKDVLVIGHTDNQPIKKSGWDDNWQLSTERALSVVRHLRAQGVAPERLVAGGCGEYRPLVPNTTAENQARNRRVEIYALERQIR
jgi:chemotaxis protein MotB